MLKNSWEQTQTRSLRDVGSSYNHDAYMKVVIDTLIEKSLREEYMVIVGGAPLNEEFGEAIGADAYCRDAAVAAETAKRLVTERRAAEV